MAGLAALTGMGAALVVLPGRAGAERPRDVCVLDCPVGTTTTTTYTPPSGGAVTVTALTPTTAAFSAPYNGGSNQSGYDFDVEQDDEPVDGGSHPVVSGGSPAENVTDQFGSLIPNTTYTVHLEWRDLSDRTTTTGQGPETSFTTPIEPAASPQLIVNRRVITIGQQVTLNATATQNPLGAAAYLQSAIAPYHLFKQFDDPGLKQPVYTEIPSGAPARLVAEPQRNMSLRLSLPGTVGSPAYGKQGLQEQRPSTSNSVFVYVYPLPALELNRPEEDRAQVQALAVYRTHAVARSFRGESVYFYRSTSAHGIARLIGHVRLRPTQADVDGMAYLEASLRFNDPGRFYVASCIRHAVLPDMGVPFTDRACGRPTLRG